MKFWWLFAFIGLVFYSSCIAQDIGIKQQNEFATIYVMRFTGIEISAFRLFIDGGQSCKLNNYRYSIHQVTSGVHTLSAQIMGKEFNDRAESIQLHTQPGKYYFVQLIFEPGYFQGKLHLILLKPEEAILTLLALKADSDCIPVQCGGNTASDFLECGHQRSKYKAAVGALKEYSKAIELQPDYAEAYYFRGLVKAKLGKTKSSIEDYTKAIQMKPDYFEAYYSRGESKTEMEDYSGSITDYDKAIELKPDFGSAFFQDQSL